MNSTGVAAQHFLTANDALFSQYAGQDVHGGPPVVRIGRGAAGGGAAAEAAAAWEGEPYYLGIFHFFMVGWGGGWRPSGRRGRCGGATKCRVTGGGA
jgi:hypothetical protein